MRRAITGSPGHRRLVEDGGVRPTRRRAIIASLGLGLGLGLGLAPALGCGGRDGPVGPDDRPIVHVVRCRPADRAPALSSEGDAPRFGGLGGIVERRGDSYGVGPLTGSERGVVAVHDIQINNGGALVDALRRAGDARVGAGAGQAGAPLPPATPPARVVFAEPLVTGAVDTAAVVAALEPRAAALRTCVERSEELLASVPRAARAFAVWQITIGPTGEPLLARPSRGDLHPPLAACANEVFRGTRFPAPRDRRVAAVSLALSFDRTGSPQPPLVEPDRPAAWTPFATDTSSPPDDAARSARAAAAALRPRLGDLEACFTGSTTTGSARVMLELDSTGELQAARAGGLGDAAIEACLENALAGLRVVLASSESLELACDLARGDAQPWRATTARESTHLVEISATRVRHGDQMIAAGEEPDRLDGSTSFLLVADPDATGATIALAMQWTHDADTTIVAVRPTAGAVPIVVGAGQTGVSQGDGSEDVSAGTLDLGRTAVKVCLDSWSHRALLADPPAIGAAVQQLATKCRAARCSATLALAIAPDALARDLLEAAGAARRAGFDRILLLRGASVPDVEGARTCPEPSVAPPSLPALKR